MFSPLLCVYAHIHFRNYVLITKISRANFIELKFYQKRTFLYKIKILWRIVPVLFSYLVEYRT